MRTALLLVTASLLSAQITPTADNHWLGIGTSDPQHPFHIIADNPLVMGIPREQAMIENLLTTGTTTQVMLAMKVWDGAAHTTCGWVGLTSGTYTFAPFANATYLENNCSGGVVILSDDATNGFIGFYAGGYTTTAFRRMQITPGGEVIVYGTDGTTNGLNIYQTANNGNAAKSYIALDLYDQSTLTGQLISTAGNYSGITNLNADAVALLAETANGNLVIGATGANGNVYFDAGSQTSRAKLDNAGNFLLLTDVANQFTQAKVTASAGAPGAGYCTLVWRVGTGAGTGKLVAYCGTSSTGVTVIDNVGASF